MLRHSLLFGYAMERARGCIRRFFNIKVNGFDTQFLLEITLVNTFGLLLFLKVKVEIVMTNLSSSKISLNKTK